MRSPEAEAERAAYHAERRARRVALLEEIGTSWRAVPADASFFAQHARTRVVSVRMMMLDEVLSPWRDLDDDTARQWVMGPLPHNLVSLRDEGVAAVCAAAGQVLDAYPGLCGPAAYAVGMSPAEAAMATPKVVLTLAALIASAEVGVVSA